MRIEFTDKNGRRIIITCGGDTGAAPEEIVLKLLDQVPDSEFIMRPVIKK